MAMNWPFPLVCMLLACSLFQSLEVVDRVIKRRNTCKIFQFDCALATSEGCCIEAFAALMPPPGA
eukprot:6178531-Pleurochrysis_carterae.AAC.1